MTGQIKSNWIEDLAIRPKHLDPTAKQSVFESKFTALGTIVTNFTFNASSPTDIVTAEVEASATADTRRIDLTDKGIYVGPVVGITDNKAVQIWLTGTNNSLDDGTGDDVYGYLEVSGVDIALHLKKHDGTDFSPLTSVAIDFKFIEIFDEYSRPVDAFLRPRVSGSIDAALVDRVDGIDSRVGTTEGDISSLDGRVGGLEGRMGTAEGDIGDVQSQINTHENGQPGKHNDTELVYTTADLAKCSINSSSDTVKTAIDDLDNYKLPILSARLLSELPINIGTPPTSIRGTTLVTGDSVLLVGQTSPSENGLYVYAVGQPLVRHSLLNKANQFKLGILINVRESNLAGSTFTLESPILILGTDPVYFVTSSIEENIILRVLEHPTNKKRLIITGSTQTLIDGQVMIQELNQLPLYFTGAQLDFETGIVYKEDGVTVLGMGFTPPSIANTKYRWLTITIIPLVVDAYNRMVGQVLVYPGSSDGDTADEAIRAPFFVGKPTAQVVLQGDSGDLAGFKDIYKTAVQRLTLGSGSGGQTGVLKEIPTGDINGTNDTFTLAKDPLSKDHVLIFVNGGFVESTRWSLVNNNLIVFGPGFIPAEAQTIEVWYLPDPLSMIGGGGGGSSTDLTNISVDMQPVTSGSHSVGTLAKPWKDIYLKDKSTSDIWRLEVDGGILQAVAVP